MSAFPLNISMAAFSQIANQDLPEKEGPRTIPLILDFTTHDSYIIDISQLEQTGKMSMVQTVYIDLSGTDLALLITVRGTGQQIKAKGRTQGFYPVLAPNPTSLTATQPAGAAIPIQLINVPIVGTVWATQ